jgi:hypothetical protein
MDINPAQLAELDRQIQRRLAFHDFWEFCLWMDAEFFERRAFLKEVAEAFTFLYLEYCAGRAVRVSVSMPPRAGKSYITSLFCAWWLGKFPQLTVMRNACTSRLYEKFSRDVRAIVQKPTFRAVFPGVALDPGIQSVEGWALQNSRQNMSYFGAGTGGTIIGFGANLAVSDDLYKSFADALSPRVNETTHEWKDGAHDSRKEKNCPEIYIGTRWLKRDIIGVALDRGRIDRHVKIPAMVDGETFCADVNSTKYYLQTKEDVDAVIWEAEYMQEPGDLIGALFPLSELKFFNSETVDLAALCEHKLVYVDPADEGGDNLAAPLGYLVGDRIYIPRAICNNFGTAVNELACADLINSEKAHAVRMEGNSAWKLFAKDVKKHVLEKNPDCDFRVLINSRHKGTRILAQSGFIKNRFIFDANYAKDQDYNRFIKVLTSYMRDGGDNQADDPADALAGMAEYYRKTFPDIF